MNCTLAPRYRKGATPPHHSITSSARASRVSGISRPSALAGLQVDDQLKSRRLLDWDIGGLRAFENLVDVIAGATEQIGETRSVGN